MIILIHADMELWDFILEGTRFRTDLIDVPLDSFTCKLQKVFRKVVPRGDYPAFLVIGRRLRRCLRSLNKGDKVIISAYTSPTLFNAVRRCVKENVSINLWMWNPVKNNLKFQNNIGILKELGYSLHSFDRNDCQRYDMIYHHSFYKMNSIQKESREAKYDFYFLGAAKDREEKIQEVRNLLLEYDSLFLIPSQPSEYISYQQNLNNIMASRCIIEVVQNQQYDITLRPLEAIAFKRKLLTNNPSIRDYPFYNSNNIFILGVDDPNSIKRFLTSPYQDVAESIKCEYDVNSWLDSF